MKLEDQVLLSFYQDISPLADNPRIMLVRHVETGQIYVRKKLSLENREIYRLLQTQQVSGIPRIHLLVETEQELIIIEEYISGLSLDAYLQKEGVLNEKDAIYVMLQLCHTLQALHSFQPPLIHRDIKPSNVILTADMRAILIDFDAAKTYSKQKQRDTVLLGTVDHAAPEQYGFSQSDARTDIYGLGVLLNYMLCGNLIRDGIYADHPEVSQIIRKATRIDPEKRYQTAEEMLDAMQQSMILDEATDKVSLNDKSRPAWTRFLPPGFREGKILNMVVATIYYIFWMYFCLTVEVKDHGEPLSGTWLYVNRFVYFMIFIITPFFWNNYLDVWDYFPLVRSPKKIWKLVGLFLYTVAWFFLVMFVFVIVEDIFR